MYIPAGVIVIFIILLFKLSAALDDYERLQNEQPEDSKDKEDERFFERFDIPKEDRWKYRQ